MCCVSSGKGILLCFFLNCNFPIAIRLEGHHLTGSIYSFSILSWLVVGFCWSYQTPQQQVQKKVYLTKKMLLEKVDEIRGAVMICYPMGLPEWDNVRLALEDNEDLSGTQWSKEHLDPETSQLWWAGKQMLPGKKLKDHIGKNEKTKIVGKIQKKGAGAPQREPVCFSFATPIFFLFLFKPLCVCVCVCVCVLQLLVQNAQLYWVHSVSLTKSFLHLFSLSDCGC